VCSISEIDIHKLIGGIAFTVTYNLSLNRNMVTNIFALPDTGALGFSFINTQCALTIIKFVGTQIKPLKEPIAIKGYNSC
jgi:hypothetical protein